MIHNSKKKLGQHFLTSKKIAERMASAAHITLRDIILEIGPGKGMLTDALILQNPKKIIAIEKDKKLIPILREKYKNEKRIEIIEGDIRTMFNRASLKKKLGRDYKVVSNIPYYLTSYLIRILLENGLTKPQSIIFMIQKEVAERIISRPPHMNLLALSVQSAGNARIVFRVTKKYFSPEPKVDSAVIIIENISDVFFKHTQRKLFFTILHHGFAHKRKMLLSNLLKKLSIPKNEMENIFAHCAIDTRARAENLSFEQWKCLTYEITKARENTK